MVITYYGMQFVKLQLGDVVIAFNPFGKESKQKSVRFGADIGIVSAHHVDMNGVDNLSFGEKRPFVISGPGEYEVGGIHISGTEAPKLFSKNQLYNTIYVLTFDGIRICFLGALVSPELSGEIFEGIGEVDLLFVPICGGDQLSPSDAEKISVTLDAKLIIPLMIEQTRGRPHQCLQIFLLKAQVKQVHPRNKFEYHRM
jgi:L-ascorbate metabolism protein UlaG (beta-lactamase superfamily)